LRVLEGHRVLHRQTVSAVASEDLQRKSDGKLHLLRALVTLDRDGTWRVATTDGQESHQLRSMAEANALLLLPDGSGAPKGASVDVLLLDPARLSESP
jgi:molybdopterin molybdotransferase